jgi:endonuclease YncB( thermonuclease family)
VRTRRTFGTRGIFANPLGLAMFVGLLAYGAFQSATAPAPASSGSAYAGAAGTFTGHVTRIVDGDTFWISSKDVRIRVWGLDAPERDTPAGPTATAALSRLISGQTLTCRQGVLPLLRQPLPDLLIGVRREGLQPSSATRSG